MAESAVTRAWVAQIWTDADNVPRIIGVGLTEAGARNKVVAEIHDILERELDTAEREGDQQDWARMCREWLSDLESRDDATRWETVRNVHDARCVFSAVVETALIK